MAKLVDAKSVSKPKEESVEPRKETYFLHPNSGELISKKDLEHDFLHIVQEIHTSLLLGEAGKLIIKANVVIFLIMLLSGLYMWWPSKKNQRKMAFRLNLKGKTQIINYSIHNVLGFYFLFPLILISLSGIWWAIKPVQKLTYAALGEKMKEKNKVSSNFQTGKTFSPQSAFETVSTTYGGWKEAHVTFPQKSKDCIRVSLRYPYEVYKKNNLFEFDQYSGKILKSELYADYGKVDKIKHANRDLHTGQNYGIIGKIIAFFSSLFAASLPITGFLIWYFKKFKKTNKIVRKIKELTLA